MEGLAYNDGDLFACIVPVDVDGNALGGYRIFPCDKKQSGSAMTVDMTVAGYDNAPGYAFALFANPAMPARTYTLHYDTDGGEALSDKTGLTFDSKDLAPQKDPVKAKHDFIGWYMDKDYTREYKPDNSYADIVYNEITATEATLYAKFETIPETTTRGGGDERTTTVTPTSGNTDPNEGGDDHKGKKSSSTGDANHIGLMVMLLALSLTATLITIGIQRRGRI